MKTYTCPDCGGENVSQDAVARWNKTRYKVQWRPLPNTGWPWTDAGEFPTREDAMQAAAAGEADHHDRAYRVIPVWEEARPTTRQVGGIDRRIT